MTLVCMYNTTVRLLLINGKPGTGKSSVSRKLFGLLPEPSAWIDTDDLMHMRPFNREHAFENALQRGLLLVEDFRHKGSMNVILTGCVHARSLWKQLQEATPKDMIIYIHLSAATDICDTRKRVQGYSEKTHPTMFQIIHNDTTDLSPDDIKPAAWIACDTSLITIEEAANQIMKLL